jgi:hypothetical protein
MFQEKCVVVKFDKAERLAVAIHSGTKDECLQKAAYCRGLYHDHPNVDFGTYPAWFYDSCEKQDRTEKGNLYELLTTSSYS